MCGRGYYDILILIFTGMAAIGTVGAVIVSLYFSYNTNKVKYKISNNISTIANEFLSEKGIIVILVNTSMNKTIYISSFPQIKISKYKSLVLINNYETFPEFKIPKKLNFSESISFFINNKQAKYILDQKDKRKYDFIFYDNVGNRYKTTISKKKLLEISGVLNEN